MKHTFVVMVQLTNKTADFVLNIIHKLSNPHPPHSKRITVSCAVTAHEIIGPYFFEDHSGNAERYLQMLKAYLFPKLVEKGMDTFHFQQDGATCHTARISMAALRNLFLRKLISKFGDIDWPTQSSDLTSPDFYLCGLPQELRVMYTPTTQRPSNT